MVKAFISYSWESKLHVQWVRRFADELIKNGIEVEIDQYDLTLGKDRFKFMEEAIAKCDIVLIICTPSYVKKANERKKGVGIETSIITPQFFDKHPGKALIPIIRANDPKLGHTPSYMSSLYFADFREDFMFNEKIEDLLRHLHGQPRYSKPPLGPAPNFEANKWRRIDVANPKLSDERHVVISHPFSSINKKAIYGKTVSIASKKNLKVSFSHMATENPEARSRITELIKGADGMISVWDFSRKAHALFRPWRSFEFAAAQKAGIPLILFSHEKYRNLVGRESDHIVFFSKINLEKSLQACIDKMLQLIRN